VLVRRLDPWVAARQRLPLERRSPPRSIDLMTLPAAMWTGRKVSCSDAVGDDFDARLTLRVGLVMVRRTLMNIGM
jgi:hypothetical protein